MTPGAIVRVLSAWSSFHGQVGEIVAGPFPMQGREMFLVQIGTPPLRLCFGAGELEVA